jgi:hypothetical protein
VLLDRFDGAGAIEARRGMSLRFVACALLLGVVAKDVGWGQSLVRPAPTSEAPATAQPPSASIQLLQPLDSWGANPQQSQWTDTSIPLTTGRNGPIGHEIYVMTGPTIPAGSGVLGQYLNTGWLVEGGGRALFFHPAQDRALTLKLGLTFQENQGHDAAPTYSLFGMAVRTRSLYRYSAVTTLGREWFRHGESAWGDRTNTLRFGFDFGARWGGQRINLDVVFDPVENTVYRHYHDIFGGAVVGMHGGFEFPRPSWVWHAGFRAEYGYNWSNMLRGQNSNIHDINLLIMTGFRY